MVPGQVSIQGRKGVRLRTARATGTEAGKDEPVGFELDGEEFGGQLATELGKALEGVNLGEGLPMAEGLDQLKASLALRKLPEDQRWQKAKDDLGLSWNQVEDL